MMDPISTTLVVGLLARYGRHLAGIAGEALDEATKGGLEKLWKAVQARLHRDPGAAAALERVGAEPDNPRRQAALEDYLDEVMAADSSFKSELSRLVSDLAPTSRSINAQVQASNSGAVAVGGNLTISGGQFAAGRDVIATPPSEQGT
jgi:hypothetical protein